MYLFAKINCGIFSEFNNDLSKGYFVPFLGNVHRFFSFFAIFCFLLFYIKVIVVLRFGSVSSSSSSNV